ncbi:unnamed protein product [Sphagnum balticum]
MGTKVRIKLLERIAQAAGTPATTGNPQGAQTTTTTTVTPAQPSMDLATLFGQINLPGGWDSSRIPYIGRILDNLDRAANASTNGKINLRSMWPTFPDGVESGYTSPTSDILRLMRKAYQQFLNKGVKYTKQLSAAEVSQRVGALLHAPEIDKLQQVNLSGPIGLAGISLESIRDDLTNMIPPSGAR